MKYRKEPFKKCSKCSFPMLDIGKQWLCEKCGWKINKKVIIGNRLI